MGSSYLKNLAKFLASSHAADNLYQHSRSLTDQERGARNRFTFNLTLVLALAIFTFLSILTFNDESPADYLRGRPGVVAVQTVDVELQYTDPIVSACNTPEACYAFFQNDGVPRYSYEHSNPEDMQFGRFFDQDIPGQTAQLAATVNITFPAFSESTTEDSLVLFMPRFRYRVAHVYINGAKERSFLNSERMTIPVQYYQVNGRPFGMQVFFEIDQLDAGKFLNWYEPVFVATATESANYLRFMESRRSNPNAQVSTTARIVLALFALILFMIVESSPESLGLALFMGFEAIGLSMSHGDLRALWLPEHWNVAFYDNYCHAMGDILRLYFYVQLARIAKANVRPWLLFGSLYAIPYAYLRYIDFQYTIGGHTWHLWMISGRDVIVACAGMLICARQAFHLRNRGLPWRVSALSLAALAASAQFFSAAPLFMPQISMIGELFGGYGSFVFFVNVNAAYFFALSTFLNISTLENRVRVLTREKTRAVAIERELELGRSVQRAFLELPRMPSEIGLSCHYEAAVYVSGDTYFVHWNKDLNVLTFLLNDVTGHGIQAALKAFACNIIARSVWNRPAVRHDRRAGAPSRLQKYDAAVEELICKDGDIPDFNAMVGAEFHQETGLVRLYRVNYNFPILIEPNFSMKDGPGLMAAASRWRIRQIAVPNRQVMELNLQPGGFLLLVSDGFLETGRDNRQFLGYLNRTIPTCDHHADSSAIRHLALQWEGSADKKTDDRTLLVFQWNPEAVSKIDSEPTAA